MKNKILGILLFPLLHATASFFIIFPFSIWFWLKHGAKIPADLGNLIGVSIICWIGYACLFSFIFGNCELMKPLTKWLLKVFKVKYIYKGEWEQEMMHSHCIWIHPWIEIKGKEYKLSFASMGGNIYDAQANLRRKILFIWLFN